MRRTIIPFFVSALGLALAAGCSTSRPTGYAHTEARLGTRGGLIGETGLFHDVLYNPESVALQFPGYIVGLDKGRRASVAGEGFQPPAENDLDQWGMVLYKRSLKQDPKLHYVSHIVKNTGKQFGEGNCIFYSVYDHWGTRPASVARSPAGSEPPRCPDARSIAKPPYQASHDALDLLSRELAEIDPDSYTHLLVVVMGWNTAQIEAVLNFNSIAAHIRAAADKPENFRPLFIGITWASLWSSSWLEPAVRLASYPGKAHDADEVGLGWLGTALDSIASTVPTGKPKIAIGHSFGARALSSALCGYPALTRTSPRPAPRWDLFIGWQPAVSINRFRDEGSLDGFTYEDGCKTVKTILFTASEHDKAAGGGFWADMIGSGESWRRFCNGESKGFKRPINCIAADKLRADSIEVSLRLGNLNYLDAKNIVWFNQPNTGGGSHSDIYRAVHGRLSWLSINQSR